MVQTDIPTNREVVFKTCGMRLRLYQSVVKYSQIIPKEILQLRPWLQCLRGNGASVLRVVPYAAFHFTAYENFRGLLARQLYGSETKHHRIPPWLDLLAGSAAGGAAVLLTYPLDLVRTRLAYGSEKQGSSLHAGIHASRCRCGGNKQAAQREHFHPSR